MVMSAMRMVVGMVMCMTMVVCMLVRMVVITMFVAMRMVMVVVVINMSVGMVNMSVGMIMVVVVINMSVGMIMGIMFVAMFMVAAIPVILCMHLRGTCMRGAVRMQIRHIMVVILMFRVQDYIEVTRIQRRLSDPADLYLRAFQAEAVQRIHQNFCVCAQINQRGDCHISADSACAV